MPRLVWSGNAERDVDRLRRFLAVKNKSVARRAVRAIRLGMKVLEKQPEIGRTLDASRISGAGDRVRAESLSGALSLCGKSGHDSGGEAWA